MNKLKNMLMFVFFILFIFGFGIYSFLLDDRASSVWENRSLAQKPDLTLKSISDGSFMSSYETYFTDQFPIRDGWMKAHVLLEKYTDQTFINDYFISKDDYIIKEGMQYTANDNINKSIEQMNLLGDLAKSTNSNLFFFYLPSRVVALEEMYPDFISAGYTEYSKDYLFEGITNENVQKFDLTKQWIENYPINERKQLFYQTDHHWNEEGAIKGYEFIRNTLANNSTNLNIKPFNSDEYKKVCSKQLDFVGSYNLQLYKLVKDHSDTPCNYISTQYDYNNDYTVISGDKNNGVEVTASGIFGSKMNNTEGDINYAEVFMQDYAEINIINNKKVQSGESTKALIIKDSFADAINFLVAENFAETSILDIRYYSAGTIEQYIKNNNFDVILILYNGETIFNTMYNFDGSLN